MKRLFSVFFTLCVVILLGVAPANGYSEETNERLSLPAIQEVDIDKVWSIEFNKSVYTPSITDNIYVIRESDQKRVIVSPLSEAYPTGKNVKVYITELYDFDETYTLHIAKDVKAMNGENLKKPIQIKFKTTNPEFTLAKATIQNGIKFEVQLHQTDEKLYAKLKATNLSEAPIPYFGTDGCDKGLSANLISASAQTPIGHEWSGSVMCTTALENYTLEPNQSIEVLNLLYPPKEGFTEDIDLEVKFKIGSYQDWLPTIKIPINL